MKKLFRKLFKTVFFRWLICFVAAQYIRFVYHTSRVRMNMHPEAAIYLDGKQASVFSFWHGRMLMIPMIHPRNRKVHVLISTHRDGEMIARTMQHFGFSAVRGSTTRGGAAAAIQAIRMLRAGDNVAVTPDGPKGPAMRLQPGVLTIAQKAGIPILPVTFSSSRCKRMRSWDSFMLPLPFSTLYYCVGKPMLDTTAEMLENEMVRITQEADIKAQSRYIHTA